MSYLDDLRALLRQIEQGGPTAPVAAVPPPALYAKVRARFFKTLAATESHPRHTKSVHERWTGPGWVERWAQCSWREFRGGLAADLDDAAVERLVLAAVDHALTYDPFDPGTPTLEGLEVARIANTANTQASAKQESDSIRTYASELGLYSRRRDTLTGSGTLFLDFVGADAVRLLLHLETLQSAAFHDEWRLHPAAARCLVDHPTILMDTDDPEDEPGWPVPPTATLVRLESLGILELPSADAQAFGIWGWTVLPEGLRILEELLADPPSSLRAVARAAIDDDHDIHLGIAPTLAPSRVAATQDLARTVVHELRNAVGPMRAAFQRLLRDATPHMEPERVETLSGRINRGLDRLEKFGTDIVQIADVSPEGRRPFDVATAIEDALADTELERNGHLEVRRSLVAARVNGPYRRVVLAFANLIRNAAQAAPERKSTLRIHVDREADSIEVRFEDDGPGVPAEAIGRIFEPGFSLGGGSGLGLAIVNAVVTDEMGGEVVCKTGANGGAVFILTFPAAAEEE